MALPLAKIRTIIWTFTLSMESLLGSLEFPKLHVRSHPSFGPLLYFVFQNLLKVFYFAAMIRVIMERQDVTQRLIRAGVRSYRMNKDIIEAVFKIILGK